MAAPTFFTPEWARAVRQAVDRGPSEQVRATKLDDYWKWVERVRDGYADSWALGVRDLPPALGGSPSYLLLEWSAGACAKARIVGPDEPVTATYVLAGDYAHWRELLNGYDAGRMVMYRRLVLEEGSVLAFFRGAYFFIESLACLATVPAELPDGGRG